MYYNSNLTRQMPANNMQYDAVRRNGKLYDRAHHRLMTWDDHYRRSRM